MTGTADQFIAECASQIGVRYTWGGDSPSVGFDCSGLIFWAANQIGIAVDRTSQEQWAQLAHVAIPAPGDLIFFDVQADGPSQPAHVAIYVAPGLEIEAPHTGENVKYSTIPNSPFERIIGYGHLPFAVPPPPPPPPPPKPPGPPQKIGDKVRVSAQVEIVSGHGWMDIPPGITVENLVSVMVVELDPAVVHTYVSVPVFQGLTSDGKLVFGGLVPNGDYGVVIWGEDATP